MSTPEETSLEELKAQKQATSGLKSFLAGGFGGISCVLVGHPFDLIKVRLQTAKPGVYNGVLDCARKTVRADGLRGLYRGMVPPLVGVTPVFAVSFWGYNLGKNLVYKFTPNRASPELSLTEISLAGAFSAAPTTLLMAPMERVKVVLQVQGQEGSTAYKGPVDAIKGIYREGGIKSLFRGTGATLLRDAPGSAAYFFAYEWTKRLLTPKGSKPEDLKVASVLFAGGMAGVAMWTIAIPPDVLKSRLQSAPPGTYSGIWDVFRKTIATDGPKALFKGWGAAMLRAIPANAATFMGYEVSLKIMNMIW